MVEKPLVGSVMTEVRPRGEAGEAARLAVGPDEEGRCARHQCPDFSAGAATRATARDGIQDGAGESGVRDGLRFHRVWAGIAWESPAGGTTHAVRPRQCVPTYVLRGNSAVRRERAPLGGLRRAGTGNGRRAR